MQSNINTMFVDYDEILEKEPELLKNCRRRMGRYKSGNINCRPTYKFKRKRIYIKK